VWKDVLESNGARQKAAAFCMPSVAPPDAPWTPASFDYLLGSRVLHGCPTTRHDATTMRRRCDHHNMIMEKLQILVMFCYLRARDLRTSSTIVIQDEVGATTRDEPSLDMYGRPHLVEGYLETLFPRDESGPAHRCGASGVTQAFATVRAGLHGSGISLTSSARLMGAVSSRASVILPDPRLERGLSIHVSCMIQPWADQRSGHRICLMRPP
jgi:hypothetical protein